MGQQRPPLASWKVLAPALSAMGGMLALRLLGRDIVSQQQLQVWIRPLGELAPLFFVLFLAVRPVTLLPGQFFAAVGGLMFGTLWATVYCLIGSFLASGLIFILARWAGTPLMRRATGARFGALQRMARNHDFGFSLLVCINPLFPTDVAEAAAAAAGARFLPVALGTLIGSVPGTLLTTQFGSAMGQGKTLLTLVSGVGLLLSVGLGVVLGRRVYRELNPGASPTAAHA